MAPKRRSSTAAEPEAKKSKSTATKLVVGEDFPDLGPIETEESTDEEKKTVDLKEILKTKGVILFFYPRANTPGCTTQACGFRDNYSIISAAGYEVFGFSADKPKSQANWKTKNSFPYHLLCDPSFEALSRLGVVKGGKSVNRSHIVIEQGGKVAVVEYGISPKDSIAKAALHVASVSGGTGKVDAGKSDGGAEEKEEEAAEPRVKVAFKVDKKSHKVKVSLVVQ